MIFFGGVGVGGVQKIIIFGGMKIFLDIFGVITELDYI